MTSDEFGKVAGASAPPGPPDHPPSGETDAEKIARLEAEKRKALEKLEQARLAEAKRFERSALAAPSMAMGVTGQSPGNLRQALREHARRYAEKRKETARTFDKQIEEVKNPGKAQAQKSEKLQENKQDITQRKSRFSPQSLLTRTFNAASRGDDHGHSR